MGLKHLALEIIQLHEMFNRLIPSSQVAFQPVPPASSLTQPAGRPILSAKAFKPPPPKMGAPPGEDGAAAIAVAGELGQEYAGKGNYF